MNGFTNEVPVIQLEVCRISSECLTSVDLVFWKISYPSYFRKEIFYLLSKSHYFKLFCGMMPSLILKAVWNCNWNS